MPSCEVQRTLVKSPPELWAELSDPTSLAKHLGEFGEIRIAHIEPETAVEWEAEDVRGVVQLKASGWGTKVTLTAVRDDIPQETPAAELSPDELATPETPEQPPAARVGAEQADIAEADIELEHPEPLTEPEPEPAAASTPEPEPEPTAASTPESKPATAAAPEPERRPGLFARLFRRRRKAQPTVEADVLGESTHTSLTVEEPTVDEEPTPHAALEPPIAGDLEAVAEPEAAAEPTAVAEPTVVAEPTNGSADVPEPQTTADAPEPRATSIDRPDLAAELAQIEQVMVEQDTALLSAVLDRLGAAHHRPFSRG
ncbi:MAG TPA: hypothetical protein VGL37_04105 [Solirubrobacteraceae bacterium]|jgi:hypothetical protein